MPENKFKLTEKSYAEVLRLIGHEVSKLQPDFLEIQYIENSFHVKGKMAAREEVRPSASSKQGLKNVFGKLFATKSDKTPIPPPRSRTFTRLYAPEEIDKIKRELSLNREWRQGSVSNGAKRPEVHSLSAAMRMIGADLDACGARLLKLTKDPHGFMVQFQNREGNTVSRDYTSLSLYQRHQEMVSHRRNRDGEDPWQDAK